MIRSAAMDRIGRRDETIGANGKRRIWMEGEDRRRDRVVFNETDLMVKSTQTL